MRRLPPLGALRAFEAAARHMSFTRAAEELCVTQAAISQQVKQLEQWLGNALFLRRGHQLSLTAAGRQWLPELSHCFDLIAAGAEHWRHHRPPLRLSVLPAFAACWLLPRLADFHRRHPDIELTLQSSSELADPADFDLAVRFGLGRWPDLQAELLAEEYLAPLCAPDYPAPASAAALRQHPLISAPPQQAWAQWFALAGTPPPAGGRHLSVNDHSHALQAAMQGQGVVLGRLFLADDWLRQGRLRQVLSPALKNNFHYWLVFPNTARPHADAAVFADWLRQQRAAMLGAD